jgi:hypothetical protein
MSVSEELSKVKTWKYEEYNNLSFENVKIVPNIESNTDVFQGVTMSDITKWIVNKLPIRELNFSNTAITNKDAIELCNFIISSPKLFKSLMYLYFNNTNVVFNGFQSDIGEILAKTIRILKDLYVYINHKDCYCDDFNLTYYDIIEGLFIPNMNRELICNAYYDSIMSNRIKEEYIYEARKKGVFIDLDNLEINYNDYRDSHWRRFDRFPVELYGLLNRIDKYCKKPIYGISFSFNYISTSDLNEICKYCLNSSLFTEEEFSYLYLYDNQIGLTCDYKEFPLLMEMLRKFPKLIIDLGCSNNIYLSEYKCDYEDVIDRLRYGKQDELIEIRKNWNICLQASRMNSNMSNISNITNITFEEFVKYQKMYEMFQKMNQ